MIDDLGRRLFTTLLALASELSVDAEISQGRTTWGGTAIDVTPASIDSAAVRIIVDGGGVTLGVGLLSTWEMYWCRDRRRWEECIRDVLGAIRVVMIEGCEELAWYPRGGDVPVETRMHLEVDGDVISLHAGGAVLSRTRKRLIRYRPYGRLPTEAPD